MLGVCPIVCSFKYLIYYSSVTFLCLIKIIKKNILPTFSHYIGSAAAPNIIINYSFVDVVIFIIKINYMKIN